MKKFLSVFLIFVLILSMLTTYIPASATSITISDKNIPLPTIFAGDLNSMAIKENGDLYIWGQGYIGQLADGIKGDHQSELPLLSSLKNIKTVSIGDQQLFAIDNSNTLWGWGRVSTTSGAEIFGANYVGNANATATKVQNTPMKLMSDVQSVSVSETFIVALKKDGTLSAWGKNSYGQLGTGTTSPTSAPTTVKNISSCVSVATGSSHTLALLADGTVMSWGNNTSGQLGYGYFGKNESHYIPQAIPNLENIVFISAAGGNSFAISADGTLYGWGENWDGSLGIHTKKNGTIVSGERLSSPEIIMKNVKYVDGNAGCGFAIKNDNSLWGWGTNSYGQCGTGESSAVPVKVMANIVSVSVGENHGRGSHVLALDSRGVLYSWGSNKAGQLGLGGRTASDTPQVVMEDILIPKSSPIIFPTTNNVTIATKNPTTTITKNATEKSTSKPTTSKPTTTKPTATTTQPKTPATNTANPLTSVDYLAFSQLAYLDWEVGQTVEGRISKNKLIDDKSDSSITYGMLCKNILDWKVIATSENGRNYETGFYAVTFCHEKTKQTVVAYRGSKNIAKVFEAADDVINDWLANDLPFHVSHTYTGQFENATDYYTYSQNLVQNKGYAFSVTGHSLGGALAETVSMTYGVYGEVFNAASVFEALYKDRPELMGERFVGVDKWNFIAHVNRDDKWVGAWQDEYQNLPYILHENTKLSSDHSLLSLLVYDKSTNEIRLSNSTSTPHIPTDFTKDGWNYSPMLVFGDSGEDVFLYSSQIQEGYMYGGNGNDRLTSYKTSKDILIGGAGTDFLNGGLGDDTYLYYKGHGTDYIYDIAGADEVQIFGLDDTDVLGWYDDPAGYKVVTLKEDKNATATPILYISTNRDLSKNCAFSVVADGKTVFLVLGSWENFYSAYVACPVDVDILDADGKIVMTLEDGTTMTEHTAYGNFYVFEDENGESCKRFDLVDGYTTKIRGIGEGTMDVCVLYDSKNPTAVTVGAEDIAVTESMTATFAFEKGKPATLLVNDGAKQAEITLQTQRTVTLDAGEGSCDVFSVQTDFAGTVPELPIPVREGYTFSGWKKADGTVVSAGDTLVTDVTLYADWASTPNMFQASFPWWGIAIIVVLVGAAVAVVILLLKKRPHSDATER